VIITLIIPILTGWTVRVLSGGVAVLRVEFG
jgi:hypothetical protein